MVVGVLGHPSTVFFEYVDDLLKLILSLFYVVRSLEHIIVVSTFRLYLLTLAWSVIWASRQNLAGLVVYHSPVAVMSLPKFVRAT